MTTPERYAAKVRDAEVALTYRFSEWGLLDAEDKAHALVQEFLRAGWKPWAPVVALPKRPNVAALPPHDLLEETRAALRAARPQHLEDTEETP